ncbi:MAG: hypothetical protein DYH00_11115 [Bacteroidetes bacterium CHB6]|nr:hypothetical protein [Bacteroidetes bacterium CHB6]
MELKVQMKKLLLVFILFGVIASNAQQLDLLKEQLKNASADTTKLRILNELTENADDFNVWPDFAKQAYELALKIAANPDSVIRKAGKKGLSAALNNMGVYNNLTGNRSAAHEMFMQSLKIREETGDDAALSETYHNLASLYFDLEEFDLAKSFFEKSARLSEKLNDSLNLAVSRNYLGMIALRKKDNEKAKEYFQQSMKMFENTGDSLSRLKTMVNLGAILYQENKLDSALKLFNEAYKINIIHNDPIKSIILINIGRVYFKQGKTDAALKYAGDALTGAKSEGIPSEIASAEYLLSEIYNASGRYQDAYSHLMMYNSLKEVLSDENVQRVIVAERVKHDYEKKIAEEQLEQKRQREIAEQEINKQKIIIEAFVAGAFLLALLIVVLIRNNRQQRKSRMELQQAYSDLKRTQQQLILQEKNASLAQFTAGIAHELKNPLNFVANFSLLSNELLQEMESASDAKEKEEIQQQLKGNLAIIRNHTERANKILSKMMQLGRSENLTRQPTNINRICEDAIEMAYTNMVSSYPGFQCDIKKSYDNGIGEVMAVTQEISMVLLNLLNNAFFSTRQKSATTHGYKPLLSIQTKMKAESNLKQPAVEIIIHDNGTGISSAVKNKIFQPFFTTKSANEGSGLGLSLSSDIIKAHGGELTFSSVENEYAEFIILLPASV